MDGSKIETDEATEAAHKQFRKILDDEHVDAWCFLDEGVFVVAGRGDFGVDLLHFWKHLEAVCIARAAVCDCDGCAANRVACEMTKRRGAA